MKKNVYGILALLACALFAIIWALKAFGALEIELWIASGVLSLTGVKVPPIIFLIVSLFCLAVLTYVFVVLHVNEGDKKRESLADAHIKAKSEAHKFLGETWIVECATLGLDGGVLHSMIILRINDDRRSLMHVGEGHEKFKIFSLLSIGDRVVFNPSLENLTSDLKPLASSFLIPTVVGRDSSGK